MTLRLAPDDAPWPHLTSRFMEHVRTWLWYLAAATALTAVAAVRSPDGFDAFWVAVQVTGIIAAVVGLRRHRPRPAMGWWLLLGGLVVSCSITAASTFLPLGPGRLEQLQLGYGLTYPLVAAGLAVMIRRRQPWSTETTLDAGIALVVAALLTWAFVLDPLLGNAEVGEATALRFAVSGLIDVVVVALAVRLAIASGRQSPALWLMLAATAALMLADVVYVTGYIWIDGLNFSSSFTSAMWLLWSSLFGAALLHPSVARIGAWAPVPARPNKAPLRAFVGLAMLGPAVLVLDIIVKRGYQSWQHALVPATLTSVLMALVILRLGALLRERESLQRELTFRAQHDTLTGLANRELFRSRLQAGLAGEAPVGLLILDLDGFKDINDTLGHPAGDELLLTAAARLRDTAGPGDLLARLGGDEYAIITGAVAGIAGIAERAVAALARPYPVNGREVHLTASVGYYTGTGPTEPGEALQNADLALYAAKEAGRNRAVRYDPSMRAAHQAHSLLAEQLRAALEHGGFTLHYQPVVDVHTCGVRAVEALLRFTAPDGTPVSPAQFVPVAEETGLIMRIGAWVLEQACTDARRWHEAHGISVTVNVSGRQLRDPAFADDVLATLRRTGLPGSALVLEITETVLVTATGEETEAVSRRLARLRAHGIRIAIDDFGTGYSSLSYLRTLPVDILKIDRAFVSRVEDRQDLALLRTVVELAKSMYMQPVAEGVETTEQAAALRELDCGYAQGFLFARPMPSSALQSLLDERAAVSLA